MPVERPETIRQVVDLLERGLENAGQSGWEVITDCRIADARPDIVVFNPRVGIAFFVVSDWVFDEPHRRYDTNQRAIVEKAPTGGWEPVPNPFGEACLQIEAIRNLFEPNEEAQQKVIARIVMPDFPTNSARELLKPMRPNEFAQAGTTQLLGIVGREQLEAGNFDAFLPPAFARNERWCRVPPSADAVRRLWDEIEPPEFSGGIPGDPLILDAHQLDVVRIRRARRVRGAAGTGKSAVLAAAAVEAALEGRKVLLLVNKTITLRRYLRSLAVRWLPRGLSQEEVVDAVRKNVEFWYLHEWIRHVCTGVGLEKRLLDLSYPIYREEEIRELVDYAFSVHDRSRESKVRLFDTLLIDEAQNLDPEWFPLLLRARSESEDRELVLMADKTQSLYSGRQDWTHYRISGGGFSGPWVTFDLCYRLPGNVVPMLADYCEQFLGDRDDIDVPAPAYPEDDTNFFRCQMQWRDIRGSDDLATEIAELLHHWPTRPQVPSGDISFVVPSHKIGQQVLEELEELDPGLAANITHVFGKGWKIQQHRKKAFRHDPTRIFGSTLHSFQGWESRCVILGVPPLGDDGGSSGEDSFSTDYWTAVYVGLSRVRRTLAGSSLIVVNAEPRLDSFLSNWFEPI